MGYYLQADDMPRKGKAAFLIEKYRAEPVINQAAAIPSLLEDKMLVCVVDNSGYDAAALCYDDIELQRFGHARRRWPRFTG